MIRAFLNTIKVNWQHMMIAVLLLFSFVVGGASKEALGFHMVLYSASWFAAGLLLAFKAEALYKAAPRMPFILLAGLFLWGLITILPFPANWLNSNVVYDNYQLERQLLGQDNIGVTLSLSPVQTLRSLLTFGPGVFALLCVALMSDKQRQALLYGILCLGVISVFLGLGQIFMGRSSPLYFWEITNRGFAVGIFANTNHQTSFAALLIPLLLLQVARNKNKFRDGDEGLGLAFLFLGILALIIIGVVAGGSLAGYGLAVFAFVLSVLTMRPKEDDTRKKRLMTLIGVLIFISAVVLLVYTSPRLYNLGGTNFDGNELSRLNIYKLSVNILKDNFLTGTGLGSFSDVYPFYENNLTVSRTFVNHAHNDWLEWALELGLPGLMLLTALVVWVATRYTQLFFGKDVYAGKRLSKAAAIGVCVLVLHSLVDYPLRTPFLGLVFFLLLGLSVTRGYKPVETLSETKSSKLKQVTL